MVHNLFFVSLGALWVLNIRLRAGNKNPSLVKVCYTKFLARSSVHGASKGGKKLQFCGRVIIAILIMSLVFISGAYGIAIGGGVLAEGTSSGILNAGANEATATGSGIGDFSGNWWVENSAGMYARVGLDICNSDSYSYDYTLNPGEGDGWPAASYPEVSASETIDVTNANYIKAYAAARSANKFDAITSIEMIDLGKSASLVGYANEAVANANGISVTQSSDASYSYSGSIDAFKCDASAIRWTLGVPKASATLTGSHTEVLEFAQTAYADITTTKATNDLNLIGVGKASVSATGNGKEAKSKVNEFTGVFSMEQFASVDPSTAQALQSIKGVGYITGEMTSAKDGWKGKEAVVTQTGAHSGNIITNKQNAQTDATGSIAGQDVELEYMPVTYVATGKSYDQLTDISYITSTKNGNKQAIAQFDVSFGEHVQHNQNAKTVDSIDEASNNLNLIGVGKASVSATGNGKEAKSKENKFIGVFSVEQSASVDPSTAQALQSMKGVGYITGGMTSAKDGWKGKEAVVTQTGAFSGNTITDNRNAQIDQTGSIAGQEVELEYMPVSYGATGTYDTHWMTFCSLAKANKMANHVTEYINEANIVRTWEVSAP